MGKVAIFTVNLVLLAIFAKQIASFGLISCENRCESDHFYCSCSRGCNRGGICCFDYNEQCRNFPCAPPKTIKGGSYSPVLRSLYPHGFTVTYKCGGTSVASSKNLKRTCINGKWTPPNLPRCRRKLPCRPPKTIKRGSYRPVRKSTYPHGFSVTYKCNRASVASSKNLKRTCRFGKWTPSYLPRCRRPIFGYCSPPVTKPLVKYNPRRRVYYVQQSVTFSCPNKYTLKGSSTSSCTDTNTWSHRFPICEKERKCQRPTDPNNGYIVPFTRKTFDDGVTIRYICDEGYGIIGKETVTCQSGKWSHTPSCREIVCPDREPPAKGSENPSQSIWYPGEEVTYKCNNLYKINGSITSTCNDDGTWSSPVPKCLLASTCKGRCTVEAVDNVPCQCTIFCDPKEENCCPDSNICTPVAPPKQCPKLLSGPNQNIVANSTIAVHTCTNGYTLLGPSIRVCENGKWGGVPPICIPPLPSLPPLPPVLPVPFPTESCRGNCGKSPAGSRSCDCQVNCITSNTCCSDYPFVCSLSTLG